MGLMSSRINFEMNFQFGNNATNAGSRRRRRRSQQDETMYSYSLNKNYFSNYFLMGGERFEVNEPDYLFGDNCDLNFLSCTKPFTLPYKQAQKNLLAHLNTKQKSSNKVSSRVNRLSTPFNILTNRRGGRGAQKQDAQIALQSSKGSNAKGSEPSQPLVMFINVRKQTLRLIKSIHLTGSNNADSDLNSLTNSISASVTEQNTSNKLLRKNSSSKSKKNGQISYQQRQEKRDATNRHSLASSRATTATLNQNECNQSVILVNDKEVASNSYQQPKIEPDIGSLRSATSSLKSGYTSVKDIPPSSDESSSDDDDNFEDALNDTTTPSMYEAGEQDGLADPRMQNDGLFKHETHKKSTKENRDITITIETQDELCASNSSDNFRSRQKKGHEEGNEETSSKQLIMDGSIKGLNVDTTKSSECNKTIEGTVEPSSSSSAIRVYNIEFYFDAEVDCSIRIFYFCTREVGPNGVTYKPQHATYKSKIYNYKKGMNQKFNQPEHTFQPYLFDEDLLIYKPLDPDGNYNSGAVFPIVIHCVALEGSLPRQSQSLVATIEKSQLDDSYSIKPLKQLIFVDGVQYILQDIYGIEHKQMKTSDTNLTKQKTINSKRETNFKSSLLNKSRSLQSNLDTFNMNISDTASLASVGDCSLDSRQNRGSFMSNNQRSLTCENTAECVICMSDERDTMLLPCRHLCLCSSCAQSLRYQANSCPICRCPFKAALNIRPIQNRLSHSNKIRAATNVSSLADGHSQATAASSPTISTSLLKENQENSLACSNKAENRTDKTKPQSCSSKPQIKMDEDNEFKVNRRESVTTSATPLLSPSQQPTSLVTNMDTNSGTDSTVTAATTSSYRTSLGDVSCNQRIGENSGENAGNLEMKPMNIRWNRNVDTEQG